MHRSAFYRIALMLIMLQACPHLVVGQTSSPPSAPATAADIAELRSSLVETRTELEDCKKEIILLRSQLQQVLASPNTRSSAVSEGNQYPTVTPSEPENQLPSGGTADESTQSMLAAKVDQMDQVKVESASKYKVRLSGMVLMNAFSTIGKVDVQDLPNLTFHPRPGEANGNVGATLRQSTIGVAVSGPEWLGARTSGDVQFDFFGGFPTATYGVTAGLVRLRTAHARLDWSHTSLIAGQDSPFFSPLSPTSYATQGEPPLSWAGNLWVWTPQIQVQRRWSLSDNSNFHIEGGVLDPMTEDIPDAQFNRVPNPGENSRRPALGAHLGWGGTIAGHTAGIGAGAYYSRQVYGFNRNVNAWGVMGDYQVPITQWLEWSGEVYRGQALGGLGGGIWKSVVYDTTIAGAVHGLDDMGGWTQLKFRANPRWEFNAAAGAANPFASDLEFFATPVGEYSPPLARNQAMFVNSIFRPKSNLLFALEYRHLRTYQLHGTKNSADHVNLAVGVSF